MNAFSSVSPGCASSLHPGQAIVFDVRDFHDPGAGELKFHDGRHDEIISRILSLSYVLTSLLHCSNSIPSGYFWVFCPFNLQCQSRTDGGDIALFQS